MDNDTSWCPVCDRQIQPKRFLVPIPQPPQPHQRQRPNATHRPRPNTTKTPVKHRIVIDQGPTPLYCSDQCQMADINRGLPHDFHPDRQSRPVSPVSFPSRLPADTSSCSSVDSVHSTSVSPSLAKLAEIYHFPSFPPPPPVQDDESDISSPCIDDDYSSGIIMAARRIAAELTPTPRKKDSYGRLIHEPRKPIPGWTDGSNAWRSSIYSLSATKSHHQSFSARSSIGVPSTVTHNPCSTSPASESDSEMLHRFSQSFTRCASRVSLPSSPSLRPSSSSAALASSPAPKRERPLLHRGAQGKLLVPDVMMRVNSRASTTSLSSQWSTTSSRKGFQSHLSHDSLSEDERHDSPFSQPKRPTVEMRSWSYDNVKTYPIMQLPPKTKVEKRKETRRVNGLDVQVEVEVEVVVVEKLKRLFLFEPRSSVCA